MSGKRKVGSPHGAERRTLGGKIMSPSTLDMAFRVYPWILAGLYLAYMGYITLRYHTVGGMGVETDFYAELYPQARKLLTGEFSPLNYGAKGPVYSLLLAGMYMFVRDYFRAGLVLNLLSGTVFLLILYHLVKRLFDRWTAALSLLAVALNYMFLSYTTQAASDLPFMAVSILSLYFLFRNGGLRDLVLAAAFGLLAFLTRYNGAFIIAGTTVFLILEPRPVRERLTRLGIWFAVFIALGLPWFIPNAIATGSPVHNDNYMNVMLEFYALGKGASYENWQQAMPKDFTGLGDIIAYDPVYFVSHLAKNVFRHFMADMAQLVGWSLGVFVIAGLVGIFRTRPLRLRLIYVFFGFVYFMILTLVFFNARFSLFLLTMYPVLAVAVWSKDSVGRFLGRFRYAALVIIAVVIVVTGMSGIVRVNGEVRNVPYFLKDLGEGIAATVSSHDQVIIARKPHTSYYAGLTPSMFPGDVSTVGELVDYCRKNGIDYILYSVVEAQYRPQVRDLLTIDRDFTGLERVYYNRYGVVYRVLPVSD